MSTAIEKRSEQTKTIKTALENARGTIAAVAAKHLTPDRLLKVCLAATQRQPKLLECSSGSLVKAAVGCAELGLEPNALGHAYLVPYGQEATLIIGYRGLLELAYRSKRIIDVTAECVFEGDEFNHRLGLDPVLDHVPNGETDADKVTHAYCVIRMTDGGRCVRVMTRKQLDAVRARSRSGSSGPWATDTVEMYRKTILRNALKYAPMSIEMVKAESIDLHADTGSGLGDLDFINVESVEHPTGGKELGTSQLKDKIAAPEPVIVEDELDLGRNEE